MSNIRVLTARYKASAVANEMMTTLADKTGWEDHQIARLAISRSLRETDSPSLSDKKEKSKGKQKELRGETLFAPRNDPDYLPWVVAMVVEHNGSRLGEDEVVSLINAHWARGLELLTKDLELANGELVEFLVELARKAAELGGEDIDSGSSATSARQHSGAILPLTVPIGAYDADEFSITLNDTRSHSNCHMAISGMSGSGKTQLAMQIGGSIVKNGDQSTGLIFIDYAKGDVASNTEFVEAIGGKAIRMPHDVLPIGPFHLTDYGSRSVKLAAEEKREVYTNLFRKLGAKQEGRLAEAILTSYRELENDECPAPDFEYVQDVLERLYEADGLQPDSLTELFRRMNAYELFWTRKDLQQPVSPLHRQRWVVDIHELGGLKEVTAFTLIEQLYREMRSLPDSEIDDSTGLRKMRCILFIDEAQYYLKKKNQFLQGLIREGRSKGFAVVLLCQSPDDFDQADFDYTEQLEFTYMLQCKTDAKAVSRLLGVGRAEAKKIAEELGRMDPLYGVGRGKDGTLPKFRVVPFFEMFGSD